MSSMCAVCGEVKTEVLPKLSSGEEETSGIPQTGDNTDLTLWLGLLLVSLAGAAGTVVYSKKKNRINR